jgi:hypothetical protein
MVASFEEVVVVDGERAPESVEETARRLLLLPEPFSRNRHFEAFKDPKSKRALQLYRRLRALVSDADKALRQGGVCVTVDDDRVLLALWFARGVRRSVLSRAHYRIVCAHPAVARFLPPA